MLKLFFLSLILFTGSSCNSTSEKRSNLSPSDNNKFSDNNFQLDTSIKVVHILVALCDNKYQGIVPVPAKIGNGQDPDNNLYWGCRNGVRSYFKNSKEWKMVRVQKLSSEKLERVVSNIRKAIFIS